MRMASKVMCSKYIMCGEYHNKVFELEPGSIICPCCGDKISASPHAMSASVKTLFDFRKTLKGDNR